MAGAIFEVETYGELPLWAQVLLASRLVRRAALWLPKSVNKQTRDALLTGCDAVERCAVQGSYLPDERESIRLAAELKGERAAWSAVNAMYYAADATHAAHDSLDFSAAESACTASVGKAMAEAGKSAGLNALQVRIFAAADVDQLKFACKEARVGRYDRLGSEVLQRLAPVHPPEERDLMARWEDEDPTGGAR